MALTIKGGLFVTVKTVLLTCLFVVSLLVPTGGVVYGETLKPLLMPGKRSLQQRVLSRPGALIRPNPNAKSPGKPVPPFAVFFVYDRKAEPAPGWIKVGLDRRGQNTGWIRQNQVIDWKQALTVAFTEPLGHDRVMLFGDRSSLAKLAASHDVISYRRMFREAEKNHLSKDSPIVAIQPEAVTNQFYLLPILSHEDIFLGSEQALLLKVASVPLPERRKSGWDGKSYRTGLVFVMDTTLSLGPYIKRTREAVRKVYQKLERDKLLNQVNFGLVGFRDNLRESPGISYVTRVFASLEDGGNPERFFERVKKVTPARVSSHEFVEDPYAGIKKAIEAMNWSGFATRIILLVTDAGARPSHDPLSTTGMSAKILHQLSRDNGVVIAVLHLLTGSRKADHEKAAKQYRELSHYPGIGSFYFGVKMGEVDAFGRVLENFAGQVAEWVAETVRGTPPIPPPVAEGDYRQVPFAQKVQKLGYALRLRYLQRQKGHKIPDLFNAWLVDRDFESPENRSLEVKILLTRNQLSDLQSVLKQVLETAEEGVLSPRNFLNDLQSLAATLSRDPAAVSGSTRSSGGRSLTDLGYMREYIEDLPFKGDVMNLSLETWEQWPAKNQLKFIHSLESKVRYYQAVHDNLDLWVSLDGGKVNGDSVFPITLEMLP